MQGDFISKEKKGEYMFILRDTETVFHMVVSNMS